LISISDFRASRHPRTPVGFPPPPASGRKSPVVSPFATSRRGAKLRPRPGIPWPRATRDHPLSAIFAFSVKPSAVTGREDSPPAPETFFSIAWRAHGRYRAGVIVAEDRCRGPSTVQGPLAWPRTNDDRVHGAVPPGAPRKSVRGETQRNLRTPAACFPGCPWTCGQFFPPPPQYELGPPSRTRLKFELTWGRSRETSGSVDDDWAREWCHRGQTWAGYCSRAPVRGWRC